MSSEPHSFIPTGKIIVPFAREKISSFCLPNTQEIVFIDLANFSAIEEYNPVDQIITVQCGIKIKELQKFLLRKNQWLPLSAGDETASLLDLILTGDTGPLETIYGGLRRHILGLTFVLSNGQLAKSGGKVVKNVSGYDLTRFLIGSYGYFALPIKAHLRIYALPEVFLTVMVESTDLSLLLQLADDLLLKGISFSYLDIFDLRIMDEDERSGENKRRYFLALQLNGTRAMVKAQEESVKRLLSQLKLKHQLITDNQAQAILLQRLSEWTMFLGRKINIVEVAFDSKRFKSFYDYTNIKVYPFLYRPLAGRFCCATGTEDEQNKFLGILSQYAKDHQQAFTVAYSDSNHLRIVKELKYEEQSKSINEINQRLKKIFDPHNCLNPFVDL